MGKTVFSQFLKLQKNCDGRKLANILASDVFISLSPPGDRESGTWTSRREL